MGTSGNNERPRIHIDKNNGEDLDQNKIEYVFPGIGTHIHDEKLEFLLKTKKKVFVKFS